MDALEIIGILVNGPFNAKPLVICEKKIQCRFWPQRSIIKELNGVSDGMDTFCLNYI